MKANELMLGDHIQVNGEVYKVISILYFDIGISDSKEDFYHEHIDNIKPIPLIAEILEKSGYTRNTFEYNTTKIEEWVSEDGRITIRDGAVIANSNNEWSVHIDNEDMQTIGYFELTYVHELQHVLHLCGIEKEIKL